VTFLSPWYLLGLLGIGIPLALHLIRREKAVKIVFSTLRFLKQAPKKNLFVQQIQQWLLLLVRVSIVALLAVAFARPFITGAFSERLGISPQSVVILLDVSMSMGYGDYFTRAKTEAVRIVNGLTSGDEAAVITFSDGIEAVKALTTERDELVRFVNTLNAPGYRTTRVLPALGQADAILKRGHPDRTIYLISDFQPQAFEKISGSPEWRLSPGVRFIGIRIADTETTNLAVTQVTLPAQPIRESEPFAVSAWVKNSGTRHQPSARVSLRIDGILIDTRTVALAEKEAAMVTFSALLKRRGIHSGDISVEDGRFPADNAYYFIMELPAPIKLLCVGEASVPRDRRDTDVWFKTALGIPGRAVFDLTAVSPQGFDFARLRDYDGIALAAPGRLDSDQINAVRTYVHEGGGLLMTVDDSTQPAVFNERFKDLSPALIGRKQITSDQDFLAITDIRYTHPIIRAVAGEEPGGFGAARFRGHWEITNLIGTRILGLENGDPLLVERTVGKGRVVLFTAPLDLQWSNFPLQVLYPPLIHETVRYLARGEDEGDLFAVGEPVPLRAEAGETVLVTGPLGTEPAAEAGTNFPFYYRKTLVPGIYTAQAGYLKRTFAVNTDRRESMLRSADPEEIKRAVTRPDDGTRSSEERAQTVQTSRREKAQHLWWWILLAVLLLSLGETILANRTYR